MARAAASVLLSLSVVLAVTTTGLATAISTYCTGNERTACEPWTAQRSCSRGGRMGLDLRVSMTQQRLEELERKPSTDANQVLNVNTTMPYLFCPVVDQLQAFYLNHSTYWSMQGPAVADGDTRPFSNDTKTGWVNVGGMSTADDWCPLTDKTLCDTNALIYQVDPKGPCGDGHAIVEFLILNVTLTKGQFHRASGFDQNVQVGFDPTCDDKDKCKFAKDRKCLGRRPGKKNCAKCVSTKSGIVGSDLRIWTSYYGTDAKGRILMSGSNNPLNFREYAATDYYSDVQSSIGTNV